MQLHKFPPDIIFVIYGTTSLLIFGLIFSYTKLPQTKIFKIFNILNKEGYNIYLWQNILFFITSTILFKLLTPIFQINRIWQFLIATLMIFFGGTAVGLLFPTVDKYITKRILFIISKLTFIKKIRLKCRI